MCWGTPKVGFLGPGWWLNRVSRNARTELGSQNLSSKGQREQNHRRSREVVGEQVAELREKRDGYTGEA